MVEEGEEVVVVAEGVEEDDGHGVDAELCPGECFHELVEGAVAAGEGDDGVGEFNHGGFAVVHGGGGYEAGEVGVSDFLGGEEFGEDADDLCSVGEG